MLALLLILLLALQQPCCCNELTNRNGTVLVASEIKQPVILQSMFNTDVTSVLFSTPSFTLVPAAWAYVSPTTPYVLARNFSILSDITPPTAIEWSFLESKLVVQRGLLVVFQNLVLLDIRCGGFVGVGVASHGYAAAGSYSRVSNRRCARATHWQALLPAR